AVLPRVRATPTVPRSRAGPRGGICHHPQYARSGRPRGRTLRLRRGGDEDLADRGTRRASPGTLRRTRSFRGGTERDRDGGPHTVTFRGFVAVDIPPPSSLAQFADQLHNASHSLTVVC